MNAAIIAVAIIAIISGTLLITQKRKTSLEFSITGVKNGKEIPQKYTCDGENISPEFSIRNTPEDTKSLAVTIENLDINQAEYKDYPFTANLIAWNIPGTTTTFTEGARPPGTIARNIKGNFGYTGPCPELGKTNTYKATIYAINKDSLPISSEASYREALSIIEQNLITKNSIEFTYKRQK